MSETHDLVIVGAGPAGIAAAIEAGRRGLAVALIDEYPEPGGQYFRPVPAAFGQEGPHDREPRRRVLDEIRGIAVDLRMGTTAWGLFPDRRVGLSDGSFLQGKGVLIATGANERGIAFPGWTLPGVMSAGGLQLLVKSQRVLPGKRVLLSGCGPFLLPVASDLADAGAEVVAVLEAVPWSRKLSFGLRALRQADLRQQVVDFARRLLKRCVPYIQGASIVEASGDEGVSGVRWARLDGLGYPCRGTTRHAEVDLVGIGYGFVPSVELLDAADARLVFDGDRGGWVPALTESLETTLPGVFAAGETAGIGGVDLALVEGRLVGLEVARRLGRVVGAEEIEVLFTQRRRILTFSSAMNRTFVLPPGLASLAGDGVILCRCEFTPAREVRAAVDRGHRLVDGMKCEVRVGMGPCQGRFCEPLCADLLGRRAGVSRESAGRFHSRPPARPVPVRALANMSDK